MDSEAAVILRRGGSTTTKKPSRTSRTESTAVFVGRATFQMIPARQRGARAADEDTIGPTLQPASGAEGEDAQREVIEALRAEARALRAESELRVAAAAAAVAATRTATAATDKGASSGATPIVTIVVDEVATAEVAPPQGVVLQMRPHVDVTEPIDARTRPRSAPRGRRSGVSPRTIVLALVAGASITLSAQAVVRRPSAPAPTVTAAPALVTPAPVKITTASAPPAPVIPTVVASTATAPQVTPPLELTPSATPRKHVRARPTAAKVRGAVSPRLGRRADTGSRAGAAWIDPFAEPKAAPAKTTAWVDPFVD